MNRLKTFLVGGAAASAAVLAAAIPATASAQGYYNGGNGYQDPCRNSQRDRSIVGGLLGAGAGIALGNNVTGRDDRDTGRIVGGVLGGLVGAGIGRNTGSCAPNYQGSGSYQPAPAYGYGYGNGYQQQPYAQQPYYAPTYSQPTYGYAQPTYSYPQQSSYGYSQPSYSGGGYTYESRTYGTVYPGNGGYYSQPTHQGRHGY